MLAVAFLSWGRRSGSLSTSSRRQITDSFSSPFISKSWTQARGQAPQKQPQCRLNLHWRSQSPQHSSDMDLNNEWHIFRILFPSTRIFVTKDKWWNLLFYSKKICLTAIGMGSNSEQQIPFHYASCGANSVNSNIAKIINWRVYFISAYIHRYEY